MAGLALAAFVAGVAVALVGAGGSGEPADPLAWSSSREAAMVAAATDGLSSVLYEKSPGGAAASAARVARYRSLIAAAAQHGPVDAATLAGIVQLESAGRPDVIAGPDASYAAGLTQIVAQTGTQLLGMKIDVARSSALTAAIAGAPNAAERRKLEAERARIDQRFDPALALAATERYLTIAQHAFGRQDLAVESYHMGIGNLQHALALYGAGGQISYARLYFDSTPADHPQAYAFLASLGDDSSTYLWRVYAAERINAGAPRPVLLPAGGTPVAVAASPVVAPVGALRLMPAAAAALNYIGGHTRTISGVAAPLTVRGGGSEFDVARRYASPAQAEAFQYMLDRLTALDVISWVREPAVIHVVVGPRAAVLLPR